MNRLRNGLALCLPIALAAAACTGAATDDFKPAEATAANAESLLTSSTDLRSDRKGIGLVALATSPTSSALSDAGFDPRRSLAVTDQVILAQFPFRAVLDQIVATSGVANLDSTTLFHQWWDTQNRAPGLGLGPHCDDQGTGGVPSFPTLNGFDYECPRAEGAQAATDPFSTGDSGYMPIGLFNRFDLADIDGFNCGEYRIVFAKRSGQSNVVDRNLVIFEGQLPNPTPSSGRAGCYPVAKFWWDLSADASVASRAASLKSFYFTGLPGFEPVVHANHYGAGPTGGGQIRSNQFMQGVWTLREYKTAVTCSAAACNLRIVPGIDKVNPSAGLFAGTDPTSTAFQNEVIAQVAAITVPDINRFDFAPSARFDTGQSKEQGAENNYLASFSGAGLASFRNGINASLSALGRSFTPEQVVNRIEALSCAGCHQLSANADLGGGLRFPQSLGFTHVSERFPEDTLDGGRFQISPALTNVFLPFRKEVLWNYLIIYGPQPAPVPCTKLMKNCCGDLVCWDQRNACPITCKKQSTQF